MKVEIVGVAKSIARRVMPTSLRRKIWDLFAGRYFERSSLSAIVAHVKANKKVQSTEMQRLTTILEENRYRPDYSLIKDELNFDFKGFSCQDLIAYLYFSGKPSGFFIDIGSFDGVEISNTYALEELGWGGICIEPIPEIFSMLEKNRNCHKYNVAISSETKRGVNFSKVSGLLGLSGLAHQMPERIKKGLENQGLKIEEIAVNTMTFGDVMKHHPEINQIDFLSIDVEGGELDVLNSIDFNRYRFELITIENNEGTATLKKYMSQYGYEIFLDLGVDLMFVPS